jgi:hypothetical protein
VDCEQENMSDRYFATNELKDAVFSLKIVNEMLSKVREDSDYWKWVFIALHNSLQGFMVTSLCPVNDFAVMQPTPEPRKCSIAGECCVKQRRPWGSREEWEAFLRGESKTRPQPFRLLGFMDLYNQIKDQKHMRHFYYQAFVPTDTQTDSVRRLNKELRNNFVHFRPKMMCRPTEIFPRIARDVVDVISFLAVDSGNVRWGFQDQLCEEASRLIKDILRRLDEIEQCYKNPPTEAPSEDPERDKRVGIRDETALVNGRIRE